jgi:hypothetical protein
MYDPDKDGSAGDYAAGFRTLADIAGPIGTLPVYGPAAGADVHRISPRLRLVPTRSEAQARAERIERDILAHIDALTRSGALDREIASEITVKVKAVCS